MRTSCLILVLLICNIYALSQSVDQQPELVVQTGHYGSITSIAFTKDSKLVASGSLDNTIKIWDVATGFQIRTLIGHTKGITSVAFSPDGNLLASGSNDYTARVWDVSTGKLRYTLTHTLAVESIAISPDGRILATSGLDMAIGLWELASGKKISTLNGHRGNVTSVAFSPLDGKILASSSWDKTVRLWDTSTGDPIGQPLNAGVALTSVAISPNGRMVAGGGTFSIVKIWDIASARELQTIDAGYESVSQLVFTPDSRFLATGAILSTRVDNREPRTVKLWEVDTGREAPSFSSFKHERSVSALAISPNGKTLAIADSNAIKLVNMTQLREQFVLKGHSASVNAIAFSSDSKSLVVAGTEPVIKQWDLAQQTVVSNLEGHSGYVNAVAYSRDNKMLASASIDKTVRLWDLASGKSIALRGHGGAVNCVAFSRDGKLLASGGDDNKIILWNAQTGEMLLPPLEGHEDFVNMVDFSPDGNMIASASSDMTIRVWSVRDGREISRLRGHSKEVECIAFSPDGQILASGSVDTTVKLWKITTVGNDVRPSLIKTLTGHSSVVQSVAFNPDGNVLASGSWDRTVRLWDVPSGNERKGGPTLFDHPGRVTSLAFNRTGKLLASASADSVKLWDMSSGRELASLIALDENDWAVLAPDGRFDASPDAQKLMRFVVGVRLAMDLNQLTTEYYEPGLLPKVSGYDKTPFLLKVRPFNEVKVNVPEVELEAPPETGTVMTIALKNEGGGIGPVSVFVGGDERIADARGPGFDPDAATATVRLDLKQFERFLLPGEDNKIEVEAHNKDNLPSRRRMILFKPWSAKPVESQLERQQLWALVVGTGKYTGELQRENLSAGSDARAIAKAFEVAGRRFFPGGVHIRTLTTDSKEPQDQPTKANIVNELRKIAENPKVTASDVLLVYLAGHGVSYGGESGDYYYLTSEASTAYLGKEKDSTTKALAGREIANLIGEIPTAKRVLILDTCAAGRINEDLQSRGADGTNQRAWAEMNRNTGLRLLAGSAANAESLEVGAFGMGLLTYSLLKGLKIDWATVLVKDEQSNTPELIDVDALFKYSKIEVNKLAGDFHRNQDPQVLRSGDDARRVFIGRITDLDRLEIPLPSKRPVYVRSNFSLEHEPTDRLGLSAKLDDRLLALSVGMDAKLFFTDARSDPGSYRLSGRYTIDGTRAQVNIYIYQIGEVGPEKQLGTSFSIIGDAARIDDLAEKIIEEAVKRIPQPK